MKNPSLMGNAEVALTNEFHKQAPLPIPSEKLCTICKIFIK